MNRPTTHLGECTDGRIGHHWDDGVAVDELVVANIDADLSIRRFDDVDLDELAQRVQQEIALIAQVVGAHTRDLNL